MEAAILSIGTELTRGELVNTNATWLAERLTALGCTVDVIETIPDTTRHIIASCERLARDHDLVIATGGLGPTTDDLTAAAIAELLAEPLRRDEASLRALEQRLARFGRPISPSNQKQADVPKSAEVLANDAGTAPGFGVRHRRASLFCLPGVPGEMKRMFERHLAERFAATVELTEHQEKLQAFGLGESAINDSLHGIEQAYGVVIGYRAHFPVVEVKLLASRATREKAEQAAKLAADAARQRLGDYVFATGGATLAETVIDRARRAKLTLSLAESCTGGLVAELLTAKAASDVFLGGVVCYANRAKQELLGVDAQTLEREGAVSQPVALQLAEGARRRFDSDLSLAITGIAGPTGGTDAKPVGTVHLAVATRTATRHQHIFFPSERRRVQTYSAHAGLKLLLGELSAASA